MKMVSNKEIEKLYNRLNKEAKSAGYHLNPDLGLTKDLVKGLLINEKRYGHWACPCRLATGKKSEDIDIICPCDYRDADLLEYGTCYCSLYVSQEVLDDKKEVGSIPERRLTKKISGKIKEKTKSSISSLSKPVWRCQVCGYLCGRDEPPEICPICKAKRDRFERFM
jgi:ferredoxin-thioredoxin reductase catalytic subunit